VAGQTREFGVSLYVVSDDAGDPQSSSLVNAASGAGTPVSDNDGALRHMYDPNSTGVTVVLVEPDGVVKSVVRNVTPQTPLRAALTVLDQSAA
jgi:hypothetical protein